jgi:hypothetical protein
MIECNLVQGRLGIDQGQEVFGGSTAGGAVKAKGVCAVAAGGACAQTDSILGGSCRREFLTFDLSRDVKAGARRLRPFF